MVDQAKASQRSNQGSKKGNAKKSAGGKPKLGPIQEDTIVQYLYKTKMCYHWQSGYCLMGAVCNFAHGVHELRIPKATPTVDENGNSFTVPHNIFNPEYNQVMNPALAFTGDASQPNLYYNGTQNVSAFKPENGAHQQQQYQHGFKNGNSGTSSVPAKGTEKTWEENGSVAEEKRPQNTGDEEYNDAAAVVNGDSGTGAVLPKTPPTKEDRDLRNGDAFHSKLGVMQPKPDVMNLKDLKIEIKKSALSLSKEDDAESVSTPKWAGWLLDTPHDSFSSQMHDHDSSICPLCGTDFRDQAQKPAMKEAEVQCDLLPAPPLS